MMPSDVPCQIRFRLLQITKGAYVSPTVILIYCFLIQVGLKRKRPDNMPMPFSTVKKPQNQRYFLKVLAVTATVSANSVAKGSTTNVGCKLNGKAR